jgi:hypothetical protein
MASVERGLLLADNPVFFTMVALINIRLIGGIYSKKPDEFSLMIITGLH